MTQVAFAGDVLLEARALPAIGERALRIALRKAASIPDQRTALSRAAEMALEYFDTQTRGLRLSAAERVRWRTRLCAMLAAFSSSRLARRLWARSRRLVPASKCRHVDLIARSRDGSPYGVRFAFLHDALDSARLGRAALEERRELAGVVIHDLEHARTRYIERLRLAP